MTATLAEPKHWKRWPINTDIIDSPACSMDEFADYRRHLYLVSGGYVESAAETLDELLARGQAFARENSRIVRVPVIPHYDDERDHHGHRKSVRPVGTTPWAGGTWIGRCGSTRWVRDADHHYRDTFAVLHALGNTMGSMQGEPLTNYNVSKLQAWWVNGVAERHPTLDGFHVECQQDQRHDGLCTALDIEWDWRDYAAWTDMGHNTQLRLF